MPHPGLPRSVMHDLLSVAKDIHLASNPCRLRFGKQEIVVCRAEFQRLLRGMAVLGPLPGPSPFEHVVATIAQQSHLLPLPLEVQVRDAVSWDWCRAVCVGA